MNYTDKMFPSEFDYETQFKIYSSILDQRIFKNKKTECKNYTAWKSVFKVAYNSINDKSSKEQLEWAFRTHLKRKESHKEYLIGVGLVLTLGLLTYYQPLIELCMKIIAVYNNNPYISAVSPKIILLFLFLLAADMCIFNYRKTIKYILFDSEALLFIETEIKKPNIKVNNQSSSKK